ncbi:hypothetical protein [Spirulina subsalsa]|nr:hypothetical protein [Spirulina subsalsa]
MHQPTDPKKDRFPLWTTVLLFALTGLTMYFAPLPDAGGNRPAMSRMGG